MSKHNRQIRKTKQKSSACKKTDKEIERRDNIPNEKHTHVESVIKNEEKPSVDKKYTDTDSGLGNKKNTSSEEKPNGCWAFLKWLLNKGADMKTPDFEKIFSEIHKIEQERLRKQNITDEQLSNYIELYEKDLKVQGDYITDTLAHTEFIKKTVESLSKKDVLTEITRHIDRLSRSLHDNDDRLKSELIEKINSSLPKGILNERDFEFKLDSKFLELDDLKEVSGDLQVLPKKLERIENILSELGGKVDNALKSSASQTVTDIPENGEKSMINLAEFMRDGLKQFENMSRLYIQNKSDLENLDKINKEHLNDVEKTETKSFSKGKLEGRIELAREIASTHPSNFLSIRTIFKEIVSEEFDVGEVLRITNDNKNELMPFVINKVDLGDYRVVKQAFLVNREVVLKAELEKIDTEQSESVPTKKELNNGQ